MITDMHDYGLNVENVFNIELLAGSSRANCEFERALDHYQEEISEALGIDLEVWDFSDMNTSEIQSCFMDLNLSGFLVGFNTRMPVDFDFTENGEIRSYSESSSYLNSFFFGDTVEDCVKKAIEWRAEIVNTSAELERNPT